MDERAGLSNGSCPPAGLWRRFFAFCLDALLLGLIGAGIGLFAFDALMALGDWGHGMGLVIALAYFGVMDSRLAGGQSVGKRFLGIRVVRADGIPLGIGAAFLRTTIFSVPYFLNGTSLQTSPTSWVGFASAFLVFGIGASILYLLIFNRRTRQSLHDLAVGAYVVASSPAGATDRPQAPWRIHFGVVALILLASCALPFVTRSLEKHNTFAVLLAAQKALEQQPGVRHAAVNVGVRVFSGERGSRTTHSFNSRIIFSRRITDFDAVANRSAQIMLDHDPDAGTEDLIDVAIFYGYDIGIASAWRSQNYAYSPEAWRRRSDR